MEVPNISALIDKGYARREDTIWRRHDGGKLDRSAYVTASEIGKCPRRIKFDKLVPPGPFVRWGWAERGHIIEDWATSLIRDALKQSDDWSIMFTGQGQISFVDGAQSGTPDGLVYNVETRRAFGLEIKSVDPRTNYSKLPKPEHVEQTMQNADLLNRCTKFLVEGAIILYIDASDLQKRDESFLEYDGVMAAALRDKAEIIMACDDPAELPPTGLYRTDGCKGCPHQAACSQIVAGGPDVMAKHERAMKDVFK